MKQRNGFVSNSSSASFIVQWQCHQMDEGGKPLSKERAFKSLMGIDCWDEDKAKDSDNNMFIAPVSTCKKLDEMTTELRPGVFETNFFTEMLNWDRDFGGAAADFMLTFAVEEARTGKANFEIVHTNLEED